MNVVDLLWFPSGCAELNFRTGLNAHDWTWQLTLLMGSMPAPSTSQHVRHPRLDNVWAGGVAEDDKDGRDHRHAPSPCRQHPGQLGSPAKPCGLANTVMTGFVTRCLRKELLPFDSFADSLAGRLVEASGDALRLLRHNPNTGKAR
jgi:hypothetical protein